MIFKCHSHGNVEQLYQKIPRSVLPAELGGQSGSLEALVQDCERRLIEKAGYFADERLYGVDETKRVGHNKFSGGMQAMQGSFTKLEID
jgi:hypothetical protein